MKGVMRIAPVGLVVCFLLFGCGQSDEIKREEFSGREQAAMYRSAMAILERLPADFDHESMFLFHSGDNDIIGLAHTGEKGFMVGNSVNTNLLTTCEFFEPVTLQGKDIQFDNIASGASGKLDGSELTLLGLSDAEYCGMGASIDGTFTRFAEIVFGRTGGKLAVKHVYRLE
ncbi:MAG: hypothetical protein V3573_01935 [Desulfovibrionaceae bacterium]